MVHYKAAMTAGFYQSVDIFRDGTYFQNIALTVHTQLQLFACYRQKRFRSPLNAQLEQQNWPIDWQRNRVNQRLKEIEHKKWQELESEQKKPNNAGMIYTSTEHSQKTQKTQKLILLKFPYKYLRMRIYIYTYVCIYGRMFYLHPYMIRTDYVGFRSSTLLCA